MSAAAIKTLSRIKESVESGAYYEAQQMYKSAYHRFKARQQLTDALHVLQDGAVTQLMHAQITCGVELGLLLAEAYTTASVAADEVAVSRILAMIQAFPLPSTPGDSGAAGQAPAPAFAQGSASPEVDECARLVAAGVKWANKCHSPISARRIHSAFASYLWGAFGPESLGRALMHFTRGEHAEEFAAVLYSCAKQGPRSEVDLWLLRAVLQVLSAANSHSRHAQLGYARRVFVAFHAKAGALDTPTVHFAELLLLVLEHVTTSPNGAQSMFQLLRDRYGDGVIRRDDSFGPLVDRVEAAYLNTLGRDAGLGGLLGGLFKSLAETH